MIFPAAPIAVVFAERRTKGIKAYALYSPLLPREERGEKSAFKA